MDLNNIFCDKKEIKLDSIAPPAMKEKLNINESFICRIWEGAREYLTELRTTNGEVIEVIDYGKKNFDSGPDYLDAVLRIGGKIKKGHIEIHQDFKHWFDHNHPSDRKYVSVILQVVLWDSKNRKHPKLRIKRELPTVVLANHLRYSIHHIWQEIINKPSSKTKLPCAAFNDEIDDELITDWFHSLAMERLKMKSVRMKERLNELGKQSGSASGSYLKDKSNWQQMLYEFIFEALGFSKNKDQMLKLARGFRLEDAIGCLRASISKFDPMIILQSALFGISGLLFDVRSKDVYTEKIKTTWHEMDGVTGASRLLKSEWHFFRLRPQNFPTRRIAYGSQLIWKLIREDMLKDLILLFQNNELVPKETYKYMSMLLKPGRDQYWNSHYNFGRISAKPENLLGMQRIDDIIVNVITPFVYLYSDVFAKQNLKKRVTDFYFNLKTKPDNSITKLINSQVIARHKIPLDTPAMEQAAIQLYNFYCTRERCNDCSVGKRVFKDTGYEYRIIYY